MQEDVEFKNEPVNQVGKLLEQLATKTHPLQIDVSIRNLLVQYTAFYTQNMDLSDIKDLYYELLQWAENHNKIIKAKFPDITKKVEK